MTAVSYADHDDVIALAPKLNIGTTTTPSEDTVDDFCAQISAEIKGVLRAAGYNTVTTDDDGLNFLRLTCAYGALALTEKALMPGGRETGPWRQWWDIYQENLEHIRKHEVYGLAPASGEGTSLPRSRYTSRAEKTYLDESVFKAEEQQW